MTGALDGSVFYRSAVDRLNGGGGRAGAPGWLAERRAESEARFRARGFPGPKDEAFRFTSLRDLLAIPFSPDRDEVRSEPEVASIGDAVRVTLVNGRPVLPKTVPEGVRIRRLSELSHGELALVEPHLFRHVTEDDGFAAHNSAAFDDAVVVVAERGRVVPRAVHVAYDAVARSAPTLSHPRVLVVCEEGSELALFETHDSSGDAAHFENSVTEVALEADAKLEHVRIHRGRKSALSVARVGVSQARSSRYGSKVFTFGGGLVRLDVRTRLDGPGTECELDGLYLARENDRLDHHTCIDHASPHATSRQRYKGILDGNGYAVFDGTVVVRRGAIRTKAHQENRNLLLGQDAVVHSKPHLEIDADDVQCSHGATVGRLDDNQLFYLRSRGIDLDAARATLTYSFAREVIETLRSEILRNVISELVLSALPEGALAREVT